MAKFEQPPAPNAPPKSATPLELAIYQFEQNCCEYHKRKAIGAPAGETAKQKEERNLAFQKEWACLQQERNKVIILTQIQAQLEKYRAENKEKRVGELRGEDHHPTGDLVKHLAAVGEPKPSPNHDAHHIIPGKGRYQQDLIKRARTNLHMAGIGIQDPRNGIFLPRYKKHKGHWSMPNAPAHREIHRYNYETWIHSKFQHPMTEQALSGELLVVKAMLRDGNHPKAIVAPKDSRWGGKE